MTTSLHRKLQEHRRFGAGSVLPSVIFTVCWVGLQWLIYVMGIVISRRPERMAHNDPAFITAIR